MEKDNSIYITTTLPYVNSSPHLGFAGEIIRADVMARYFKLLGHPVFFNTGTDEHGTKIWEKAKENNISTQAYVDEWVGKFKSLVVLLGLSEDIHFIRTTDENHKLAAQEMWRRCDEAGYIYKKAYQTKYCVGCELEKTDSELVSGRCSIHTDTDLEVIDEENYFFRFSAFADNLLELYKNDSFLRPDFRRNEIVSFIESGLKDFSISRLKEKMPWGISVPNDDEHVMYVWFDALTNYISTLGWPKTEGDYDTYWKNGRTIQFAGKDNLRQQAAMWQAMLLAAGEPTTDNIIVGGFINIDGQKMSKSQGNVITPNEVVEKYGTEAIRYFVMRHLNNYEDTDVSWEKIAEAYNAGLVNGLGNLVNRVLKMAEVNLSQLPEIPKKTLPAEWIKLLGNFDFRGTMDFIWQEIGAMDEYISENEPYRVVKNDKELGIKMISDLLVRIYTVARMLSPFMPKTSEQIKLAVKEMKKPKVPMFARID